MQAQKAFTLAVPATGLPTFGEGTKRCAAQVLRCLLLPLTPFSAQGQPLPELGTALARPRFPMTRLTLGIC